MSGSLCINFEQLQPLSANTLDNRRNCRHNHMLDGRRTRSTRRSVHHLHSVKLRCRRRVLRRCIRLRQRPDRSLGRSETTRLALEALASAHGRNSHLEVGHDGRRFRHLRVTPSRRVAMVPGISRFIWRDPKDRCLRTTQQSGAMSGPLLIQCNALRSHITGTGPASHFRIQKDYRPRKLREMARCWIRDTIKTQLEQYNEG